MTLTLWESCPDVATAGVAGASAGASAGATASGGENVPPKGSYNDLGVKSIFLIGMFYKVCVVFTKFVILHHVQTSAETEQRFENLCDFDRQNFRVS